MRQRRTFKNLLSLDVVGERGSAPTTNQACIVEGRTLDWGWQIGWRHTVTTIFCTCEEGDIDGRFREDKSFDGKRTCVSRDGMCAHELARVFVRVHSACTCTGFRWAATTCARSTSVSIRSCRFSRVHAEAHDPENNFGRQPPRVPTDARDSCEWWTFIRKWRFNRIKMAGQSRARHSMSTWFVSAWTVCLRSPEPASNNIIFSGRWCFEVTKVLRSVWFVIYDPIQWNDSGSSVIGIWVITSLISFLIESARQALYVRASIDYAIERKIRWQREHSTRR